MPNTITAYHSFTAGSTIKSSEHNTNFSNHRGTLLPIDENTAAAADLAYDVGNSSYRFKRSYANPIPYSVEKTSTYTMTTSDHTIRGNCTSGALTIELPDASACEGQEFFVYKSDSSANTLTVQAYNNQTVDGNTTTSFVNQYYGSLVKSDGSNYTQLNASKAGSVPDLSVSSKTANYTALTTDDVILCDSSGGAFTITLYTASGNSGKVITITKTSSGTPFVTIDGNAAETIGGNATTLLKTINSSITLVSDGTNWQIKEDNRPRQYSVFITNNGTATVSNDFYGIVSAPGRSSTGSGAATFTSSYFTNIPNILSQANAAGDSTTQRNIHIYSITTTGFSWVLNEDLNDTRAYKDMDFTIAVYDRDLD